MAEEFDPRWEYYTGDPEVLELLSAAASAGGFDSLPTGDHGSCRNAGLRFGTGVVDKSIHWVCREPGPVVGTSACGMCHREFRPNRLGQSFCGRHCAARFARACRPDLRPVDRTPRPCPVCRATFAPDRPAQRTCSVACGNEFRRLLYTSGNAAEREALERATGKPVPACKHCRGILPPHKRRTRQVKLFCSVRCCVAHHQGVARRRRKERERP